MDRTYEYIDEGIPNVPNHSSSPSGPCMKRCCISPIRTMHEKMLYIEALRKGFEALGRPCHVTNMNKLEGNPSSMPASGPTLVLGKEMYMNLR